MVSDLLLGRLVQYQPQDPDCLPGYRCPYLMELTVSQVIYRLPVR
jgi:hypothetical protein